MRLHAVYKEDTGLGVGSSTARSDPRFHPSLLQRSKKTLKQIKKDTNFPARKFALRAA